MRLLHTSDWHLGMSIRGGISYRDDQQFAINQICDIALREEVQGIIIAGDIFDKSIASQEAIRLYDDIVTNICNELGIQVYIIAGNHDGADRLAQCARLLRNSGLFIAGALEKDPQIVRADDVDIYMLPWISTDKVRNIYPDKADSINTLEDAYRVVLDNYREAFVPGQKNVLISHAFVRGGRDSGSDMDEVVGKAVLVDAGVFEGFDYVALGHLHGPQQITDKIRYSGTPMAYSFGREEKQTKSVTIYDTETEEQKVIELPQLRKRTTITDTLDKILLADYDEDILKGFVKLVVTDKYVGFGTASLFREKYENLVEYTCPSIDSGEDTISMTIEDLEKASNDPKAIFESYLKDNMGISPSKWFVDMFDRAYEEYVKEVSEQ